MQKEITINGKKYVVKEMPYVEAINVDPNDRSAMAKKMLKLCVGLSDEDINNLSIREGTQLQNAINEVNYGDFQTPTEDNKS